MANITIVNGVYKPTYNWGAPSCGNPGIMKEASFFPHPGTTQQDLFLRPCLERLALVASRGAAGSPGDDGGAV